MAVGCFQVYRLLSKKKRQVAGRWLGIWRFGQDCPDQFKWYDLVYDGGLGEENEEVEDDVGQVGRTAI